MPIQAPQWTEFLSCPVCINEFAAKQRPPISLGCGHTICRTCLATLHNKQCPFDQTSITTDLENLPINNALLQLVGNNSQLNASGAIESDAINSPSVQNLSPDDLQHYKLANKCIEELALYLKPFANGSSGCLLSRPMQRKLVTLVNCQLIEDEGRTRALRAARSLGERTVTELILQHQNPQQLSSNLWAAVRARGCQFLGPAMQEEVLKLVLLALEDGSALSRKVLVMFVVQRLEPHFSQASKTSIGHVVQLLYRASCFKVSKRDGDSSLMQLKEEFRTYDALRREHDAQIVQIATEAGLRIAPDQWSALLYGDTAHKSHMQSIIDKLQTPQSFAQSVQELVIALQRTGDPANLSTLRDPLNHLANIDPSWEANVPWKDVAKALEDVKQVVIGLVEFVQHHGNRKLQESSQSNPNPKYKISYCRDLAVKRICPRGTSCTFAHSEAELEKYRLRSRKNSTKTPIVVNTKETAVDYLDTPTHSHLPSEETSPMRFAGAAGKTSVPPQPPQTILPPAFMDACMPPMHAPSPIPSGGTMNPAGILPNVGHRHQYDNPYNMNYSVRTPLSLRSPRPNFAGGPAAVSPQQQPPPPPSQPPSNPAIFHAPMNNLGNFPPSDIYNAVNAAQNSVVQPSIQQTANSQGKLPPMLPGNNAFFAQLGNRVNEFSKPGDMLRQHLPWEQQMHRSLPQQQQQSQQQISMNLNTPPNNSPYMNSPNNNNNNNNKPNSDLSMRQIYECRKQMELNLLNKNLNGNIHKNFTGHGQSPHQQHVLNNNLAKDDILPNCWTLGMSQIGGTYGIDTTGAANAVSRDPFVRSDSILQEDDYIPFETTADMRSKFGPISRMPKNSATQNAMMSHQSQQQSTTGPYNDNMRLANVGNSVWPYNPSSPTAQIMAYGAQMFETGAGGTVDEQTLKNLGTTANDFNIAGLGAQEDFLFSKSSDIGGTVGSGGSSGTIIGPQSKDCGKLDGFSVLGISDIDSKDKDTSAKLTPMITIWKNSGDSKSLSPTASFWDTSKETTPIKNEVPEEGYEDRIANDIRQLELRLESELAEHEELWPPHSEDAATQHN